MFERINRVLDARLYYDEPLAIEYQPVDDETGVPEDLAGRVFLLTARRPDRSVPAGCSVICTWIGGSDPHLFGQIPATPLRALLGVPGWRYQLAEILSDGGQEVVIEGGLTMAPAAGRDTDAVPSVPTAVSVTRFVVTLTRDRPRVVVKQRGSAGQTAAQALFAAGLIDAPTTAAMDARYMSAVVGTGARFPAVPTLTTEGQANFTMAQAVQPGRTDLVDFWLGGVLQEPLTYAVAGNVLTLLTPALGGLSYSGVHRGPPA